VSGDQTVFASGADVHYGYHVINLVASLQANSNIFDRIVVFDLGMSEHQRRWLRAAPAIELREVPPFVPHWNRGFTWKPWAWLQLQGGTVVWVDAGSTILGSLSPMVDQVGERGYFLVSQGGRVSDILPQSYFELYVLPSAYADRPYAAAGILGFRRGSAFFEQVLLPTYEDCLHGRNLGFSAGEVRAKNRGLQSGPVDAIHDCAHFRWDQSVLNAHLLRALPTAVFGDPDEYGGWRSPRDHPQQRIWNHRRRGSLTYAQRLQIPWPVRIRWYIAGRRLQLRWWIKLHGKPALLKVRLSLRRRLGR
jgi:hypothetical protein